MKVALINPPTEHNIVRRWRCAIEQGNYLFPPMELCYLAGMVKSKGNIDYKLVDCVGAHIERAQIIKQLEEYKPDILVFMPGFESVNRDVRSVIDINATVKAKLVMFGHYPTKFSDQLLKSYPFDYILRGDPEFTFSELLTALQNKGDISMATSLTFVISLLSFGLSFAVNFYSKSGFVEGSIIALLLFIGVRFATAMLYTYQYVLNPVFYLEYEKNKVLK